MKPNPSWVITGDHCFVCALSDATMTTNSTLRCARRQVRARWCPRRPSQRPSLPTTTPSLHLLCAWFILCDTHVRGHAVLPRVDIRFHARGHPERVKLHSPCTFTKSCRMQCLMEAH
eukprot:scaffold57679_cov47-Phaeocystis_antarctica.AAC.8